MARQQFPPMQEKSASCLTPENKEVNYLKSEIQDRDQQIQTLKEEVLSLYRRLSLNPY